MEGTKARTHDTEEERDLPRIATEYKAPDDAKRVPRGARRQMVGNFSLSSI